MKIVSDIAIKNVCHQYFYNNITEIMAPCIGDKAVLVERETVVNALQLNNLKKAIPKEAFQKSIVKSTYYMIFDYAVWFGSVYGMFFLTKTSLWSNMPFWLQALASVIFWNIAGFYMWCLFMIGHDCGHSTFSNYTIVNDIVGHISHGSLLVPYFPWQLSHRRHHMYHNHVDKDYSHPWYTPDRLARPDEGLARMMHNEPLLTITFPIYGWHLYLFGMPDGSHYYPFTSQRLWASATNEERLKCIGSSAVCAAFLTAYYLISGSLSTLAYFYLAPYVVFGWWLVTVTYLQHHSPETKVYDDADWKFVDAAFETVDRKFGFGIDTLHHHITDGHVAHHLFFTKIPHYNLPIATKAIQQYMQTHDLGHMYKCEDTFDFPYRVHKYFMTFGFKATRASVAASSKLQAESATVEAKKVK